MNLYIQRHCEPTPGERMDGSRQLTDEGIRQANEMAAFLVREIGRVDITISSPFARALETAAIMAPALGSHIATTRMLEPDGKPVEMWDEITRLAQQSKEVLVIGHHPAIGNLLTWLIAGDEAWDESGENIKFKHGGIAHVKRDTDGSMGELHWFVTPKLVERDEDAEEIKESAGQLVESLNAKSRAALVDPLIARAAKAIRTRFEAQRSRVKKALADMKPLMESFREAPQRTVPPIARHAITVALTVGVLDGMDDILSEAHGDGVALANDSLGTDYSAADFPDLPKGDTGGIDRTTEGLIGTALTDAFEKGLGFAALAAAVDSIFDTAEDSRSDTIAENEVSDAFHQGMTDVATAAQQDGAEAEKLWSADDDACEDCQANADQDWIGADEDFGSGDDAPPAHPNCRCGLELRTVQAE